MYSHGPWQSNLNGPKKKFLSRLAISFPKIFSEMTSTKPKTTKGARSSATLQKKIDKTKEQIKTLEGKLVTFYEQQKAITEDPSPATPAPAKSAETHG